MSKSKLEELSFDLIKAQSSQKKGTISQVDLNKEVGRITKEGELYNLSKNQILQNAMSNQDAYLKQIESAEK